MRGRSRDPKNPGNPVRNTVPAVSGVCDDSGVAVVSGVSVTLLF
jgi:hypothetical protein